MLVVGLTGGIASGKLTVSRRLSERGVPVIDADVIAREVVEPGRKAYAQVVAAFGSVPNLVNEDALLNRAALGQAVFGNRERLAVLNGIVHHAVKKEIAWRLLKAYLGAHRLVVLDVPLLFELGLDRVCGATVAVSTDGATQLQRLLSRNAELSTLDAEKRIQSQMSTDERNFRADRVIDNDGSVEELHRAVDAVFAELTPSVLWTYLDLVPPVGALLALSTILFRFGRDFYLGSPKKQV